MLYLDYTLCYEKNVYFCFGKLKYRLHRGTAVHITDGLHYIMIKHK